MTAFDRGPVRRGGRKEKKKKPFMCSLENFIPTCLTGHLNRLSLNVSEMELLLNWK